MSMIHSMPSKWASYLGIIYGVVIVLKKISETWKSHQINRNDVLLAKELYKQRKIETEQKRFSNDEHQHKQTN